MSDCVLGVGRLRASLLLQATTTFGTLLEQLRPHILACHKTASKCVVPPSMVYHTIPYTHEHVPKLNSEKPWQPCTCDNARCMTLTPCSTTGLFDVLCRSVHRVSLCIFGMGLKRRLWTIIHNGFQTIYVQYSNIIIGFQTLGSMLKHTSRFKQGSQIGYTQSTCYGNFPTGSVLPKKGLA